MDSFRRHPGYPGGNLGASPTGDAFLQQMTGCSDEFCNISGTQSMLHPFGPYLTVVPYNPVGTHNTVLVVTGATMPEPDAGQPYGWVYNPQLQKIIVNQPGNDAAGVPYKNY